MRTPSHPPRADKSAPTADRMNVSMRIIGPYRWPDYFVNVHEQSPRVTLSAAKGPAREAERSFAALRMTGLDLAEKKHQAGERGSRGAFRAICNTRDC